MQGMLTVMGLVIAFRSFQWAESRNTYIFSKIKILHNFLLVFPIQTEYIGVLTELSSICISTLRILHFQGHRYRVSYLIALTHIIFNSLRITVLHHQYD